MFSRALNLIFLSFTARTRECISLSKSSGSPLSTRLPSTTIRTSSGRSRGLLRSKSVSLTLRKRLLQHGLSPRVTNLVLERTTCLRRSVSRNGAPSRANPSKRKSWFPSLRKMLKCMRKYLDPVTLRRWSRLKIKSSETQISSIKDTD